MATLIFIINKYSMFIQKQRFLDTTVYFRLKSAFVCF
jgi:hypothetical protein